MTGSYSCALQDAQATDDGAAAVWPGELDEQLISELLSDDSFLGALQVPSGDSVDHYCSGDTGPDIAAPVPYTSGGERELPQPAAVSRALCSLYSGPTIQDIEKALSSRPCHPNNLRSSPMYLGRFGVASRGPGSKYTTKVRSCSGKTPSDGFKWRKYGQKTIKNNLYPRSYYKCTSYRCGAKKHVEKCVDDPDMLVVTYEGRHLHDPQPSSFQRRRWTSADIFLTGAAAASGAHVDQLHTGDSAAEARGGGGVVARGDLRGRQNGRAEDVVSSASVAAPRGAAALPCDSPPTPWSCPDIYYPSSSWSPEALLP